jgi:protoporphyrinogen oxidase
MNKQPVVIVGGGPAGLTGGYELSKLGLNSVVLEGDTQVGGISRTVNYKGYRFDIGGHRFFSKVPYVEQLWNEILGDNFLLRPRLSRIHYRGHFFDYPLKAFNALKGLGPFEAFMILLSYGKTKFFPIDNPENFEEWVASRFGYRLYEIFFKTYTEKVWGIPCNEISAEWAAQRIKNLSLKEAVRNALFGGDKEKGGEVITTLIERFHYPRLGPGMMWESCRDILKQKGNPTIHDAFVERVKYRNKRVEAVISRDTSGNTTEYGGHDFLSSMPLKELILALDPPPPAPVLEAARNLRYRDYLTVVLIVNRENVFPDNWIYIHTPDVKMGRIQNYKNWSPEMVPDPSKTALGLEYFLWEKDDEWRWPDERLIELGIQECAAIGMIEPGEVEDGTVVRMKKAYPVYDQNYGASLEILQSYMRSFENLQTVGRNGLHRYNNQDHSMLTGVYAARNITGKKYDVWTVNTEKEYHEEGEVKETLPQDRLVPTRVNTQREDVELSPDQVVEYAFARIDPVAMGIAAGAVCGLGLFLASAVLLLKGGPNVGVTLALLGNYLPGYKVNWLGAFLGLFEGGIVGFILGFGIATMRNWAMTVYASLLRHRAEKSETKDILDRLR